MATILIMVACANAAILIAGYYHWQIERSRLTLMSRRSRMNDTRRKR